MPARVTVRPVIEVAPVAIGIVAPTAGPVSKLPFTTRLAAAAPPAASARIRATAKGQARRASEGIALMRVHPGHAAAQRLTARFGLGRNALATRDLRHPVKPRARPAETCPW